MERKRTTTTTMMMMINSLDKQKRNSCETSEKDGTMQSESLH
jgi:hypothetical protein